MQRRQISAISRGQIKIAQQMHGRLALWRTTEDALLTLNQCYPGHSLGACLVKAATVNALYSTHVLAITRMGRHVHTVLQQERFREITPANSIELVEAIADLTPPRQLDDAVDLDTPSAPDQQRKRQFRSFASKFCAFFVDRNLFPIYDDAAREAIKHHLSSRDLDRSTTYGGFVKNIHQLRDRYALYSSDYIDLDRYLWLRGMYDRYARGDARVNRELREYFLDEPYELATLLGNGL
ncbi:hypothetical protein V5279_42300 [Bradyrhizobium sp. 26S5]|uniref:hypothetical protein n=1 Tax=Bradyrhizobium sp. 26S5 TaxID=3139729 RepID=UPI0030CF223D